MSILKQTEKIRATLLAALCIKKRRFDYEPVFIKETDSDGEVHCTRVLLTDIYTGGQCVVVYPYDNEEQRSLSDICTDSLLHLLQIAEPQFDLLGLLDEQFVYAYPVSRFERNASDSEILSDYEHGSLSEVEPVRKFTVQEFLSLINDENFDNLGYWVRMLPSAL